MNKTEDLILTKMTEIINDVLSDEVEEEKYTDYADEEDIITVEYNGKKVHIDIECEISSNKKAQKLSNTLVQEFKKYFKVTLKPEIREMSKNIYLIVNEDVSPKYIERIVGKYADLLR